VLVEHLGCGLQGKPGLARPTGSRDGDQSGGRKQLAHRGQVVGAADERAQLDRQVVGDELERPQRRELLFVAGMAKLIHVLRAAEVAKPVAAEIDDRSAVGQALDDEIMGRARQQNLSAVSDCPEAGAPDDRAAEVVRLVAQLGLTGVQCHTDLDGAALGPAFVSDGELGTERRSGRVRRSGEGSDHAVALALLEGPHTTMATDCLVEDRVMAGD
jgi:hypothetical protein